MEELDIEALKRSIRALQKSVIQEYQKGDSERIYQNIMLLNRPFMQNVDNCILVAKIIMQVEIEFIAMKHQPNEYSMMGVPYDRIIE